MALEKDTVPCVMGVMRFASSPEKRQTRGWRPAAAFFVQTAASEMCLGDATVWTAALSVEGVKPHPGLTPSRIRKGSDAGGRLRAEDGW